jgi:hypothetical protein
MSTNNYLLINRKTLEITMRDADTGCVLEKIGKAKNLNEAINLAQDCQQKEIVEYGINFTERVEIKAPACKHTG